MMHEACRCRVTKSLSYFLRVELILEKGEISHQKMAGSFLTEIRFQFSENAGKFELVEKKMLRVNN